MTTGDGGNVVQVHLVPEKKGLFLKHVEYEVTSQRYKLKVCRRYNDFVALQDLILLKYPYRMIPRLPPKKMVGADARFIEQRRRALLRFLTLVVRHPILGEDAITRFFFCYNGPETQYKIREQYRNVPDEYLLSDVKNKKDLVPADGRVHLATSREQIRFIHGCLSRLEEIVTRMVNRSRDYATDILDLRRELSSLAREPHITSTWATGGCDTWNFVKTGCRELYQELSGLSETATHQAGLQEQEVLDQLSLFVDLLTSYKDLCERHERGAIQDHQKVMNRVVTIRKKVQQVTTSGATDSESKDDIESRIVEQENHLQAIERRNQFALYCIHAETRLVHKSMAVLVRIFQAMASVFMDSHVQLSQVWRQVIPVVQRILPSTEEAVAPSASTNGANSSPSAPPLSLLPPSTSEATPPPAMG